MFNVGGVLILNNPPAALLAIPLAPAFQSAVSCLASAPSGLCAWLEPLEVLHMISAAVKNATVKIPDTNGHPYSFQHSLKSSDAVVAPPVE